MGLASKNEKEITTAVKTREGELKPLRTRFEDDLKLWIMEEVKLDKDGDTYENYTSNKPRTLVDKIAYTLAEAPLSIQLTLDKDTEESRKAKSNAECFIYGNISLADDHFGNIMLPSTQAQLAWHSTFHGWYAIRVFINRDKDGVAIPRVAIWDMINVTWRMGADGMAWVCNKRSVPIDQAIAEWGYKGGTKKGDVTIHDTWDDEANSVIIEGAFVKRPWEHKLGHCPVLIVSVGATPPIQSETLKDVIKYWGEGVLAPNRREYPQFNRLMTYAHTNVGEGVHAPIGVWSSGGKKGLERSPYGTGRVTHFDSDTKEEAKPLLTPANPRDIYQLIGITADEIMMGGTADILYGIDEPSGSGRRANLLAHAASTVLNPPKQAIERGIAWMGRELLTQYAGGDFKGLKLRGEDWNNKKFNVDLKPEDVEGDWYPEVKLLPKLPEDEHGKIIDAVALVRERLSSREAQMDKLGVKDTDLEFEKMAREEANDYPPIKLRKMAAALIEEGGEKNKKLAQLFLDEIDRMERTPAPPTSPQQTGYPPDVFPPEELEQGGGI